MEDIVEIDITTSNKSIDITTSNKSIIIAACEAIIHDMKSEHVAGEFTLKFIYHCDDS